jgi:hypothetical protein
MLFPPVKIPLEQRDFSVRISNGISPHPAKRVAAFPSGKKDYHKNVFFCKGIGWYNDG